MDIPQHENLSREPDLGSNEEDVALFVAAREPSGDNVRARPVQPQVEVAGEVPLKSAKDRVGTR